MGGLIACSGPRSLAYVARIPEEATVPIDDSLAFLYPELWVSCPAGPATFKSLSAKIL